MEDKVYQVFIQDEYNNNYFIGFYADLDDSINDLNEFLKVYNAVLEKGDIHTYTSSFGQCFDTELNMIDRFEKNEDIYGVMVRGFIFDKNYLKSV